MISIKVDTKNLQRALRDFKQEIPTALRNAINDIAFDVAKREKQEMRRVFNRPKKILQDAAMQVEKATKTKLVATVGVPSNADSWVVNTLTPHIPGFTPQRKQKAFERALAGFPQIGSGYLVPSRTHKQAAAERGSTISKMLNDMQAFKNVAGFTSETRRSKRQYVWRTVNKRRGGGTVTGIFEAQRIKGGGISTGAAGSLKFLVVEKGPVYRKRFEFFRVGIQHANKVADKHLKLAIRFALKRAKLA